MFPIEPDDVIVREELTEILDDFCAGFGVGVTLFSRDGRVLLTRPNNVLPAFCTRIRDNLYGTDPCNSQLRRMIHLATERHSHILYTCHAGLRRCVFPILSGKTVIAVATIVGFRYSDEPSASALRDWKEKIGVVEPLVADFHKIPQFSTDMEVRITRLFGGIVDHAIAKKLIESIHPSVFEEIVDYVRNYIHHNPFITVDEVASHVGKSASSVTHIVKKEIGIPFKRFVIEQRLRAAEDMFVEDSTRSIGEVADSLGFSDQFYFSRIYRKYRGYPPRDFIRRRLG
jgi:AraC-like DNA-binding protein